MFVATGFSDTPDSHAAGRKAVRDAMQRADRSAPCQLVLLFATARHDAAILRQGVLEEVGHAVQIVGGGAIGVMTNNDYGYAGDQVGVALMWFANSQCSLLVQEGVKSGHEHETGMELGLRLREQGTEPQSPLILLYDAIDRSSGDVRLIMAAWLLEGLKESLGFLPDIVGAGLQGDYILSPTEQWTGDGLGSHTALAMSFSGEVRLDHVIMHGCRPGTGYYTVTKAEGQTILEINNIPALTFMDQLLQGAIPQEQYPFFLLFGVSAEDTAGAEGASTNKWRPYVESNYASRLCLAIDKERQGIVMFEPDMVEGTEFQIMYRSLELGYMLPQLDKVFSAISGRKPVFALYIDCGGRAAGYGGTDIEDALVVQNASKEKVPLLGIYSGVEIASVNGSPRGLDWTGVFCIFSVPDNGN